MSYSDICTELLRSIGELSLPVNVESVADKLGIKLVYEEMPDDISGFIDLSKDPSVCAINRRQHFNRQRFTIAHEIGHFRLHRNSEKLFVDKGFLYRDADSSSGEVELEREANAFAAELLMPKVLLSEKFYAYGDSFESDRHIPELARQFRVSEQAMLFRLTNLKLVSIPFS